MKHLAVLGLGLCVAACGGADTGPDTGARLAPATRAAAPLAPAGGTATTPGDAETATPVRPGVGAQPSVAPSSPRPPTPTNSEGISTPGGRVGTTGAF